MTQVFFVAPVQKGARAQSYLVRQASEQTKRTAVWSRFYDVPQEDSSCSAAAVLLAACLLRIFRVRHIPRLLLHHAADGRAASRVAAGVGFGRETERSSCHHRGSDTEQHPRDYQRTLRRTGSSGWSESAQSNPEFPRSSQFLRFLVLLYHLGPKRRMRYVKCPLRVLMHKRWSRRSLRD
jgi:hypothetical protein